MTIEYNRIGAARRTERAASYNDILALPYELERHDPEEIWPVAGDEPWPEVCCPDCGERGDPGRPLVWAEAGYVPGHRICPWCGGHFNLSGEAGVWTLRRARFTS